MNVHDIVVTVSIIFQISNGNNIGSASGFFFSHNNDLYLVTNKHVVRDDKKGVIPDTLRLLLHTDMNDLTKNSTYDIPLYENQQPLWKTHLTHTIADVAVLKLDKNYLQKHFIIKAWSEQSFLPKNYRLDPGEDVFIIGYPLSFRDSYNNLPIFRDAMIASTFRVYFQNFPLFLIDANLHPGTSGSPVITKPKSTWVDDAGNTNFLTGTVYYLLGIHSGTVDKSITNNQEIGLGAAWYADLIIEIINQF